MLKLEQLNKVYPNGTRALNDVSFQIETGEFVVILGKSGSGKSTLLRTVNGLVEPTSGTVSLDGQKITGMDARALRALRRRIGMIFQNFNLVDRLSVLTNVLTGRLGFVSTLNAWFNRFPSEDVEAALGHLNRLGLQDRAGQRADRLSGGQRQRVGIARALMQNPSLLLADEPVSNLDPASAQSIMDHLREIHQQGVTLVCNLHFPDLARKYATRLICLKEGRVVFDGAPDRLGQDQLDQVYGTDGVH